MKKLLLLSLLFASSFSLQSQALFNDTMLFRVDNLLLQLENRLEGITPAQSTNIRTSLQPIMDRARGQKLTQQQRIRVRRNLRQAVIAELTPAQVSQLKATRQGDQDLLDRAISGQGARKQRQ